jgi:serine/alanine adding enzyme
MAIEIVRQVDERRWREFVDNHPQSQIFHTSEMFQVFARAKGHRPSLWAAVRSNGQVLALLVPVQIVIAGGLLSFFTTRAVAYGSVLVDPSAAGQEALSLLLQAYSQGGSGRALFTELRNLSDLGRVQAILRGNGFIYEDHLNYLLDLQRDPETILQSFKKDLRHHIRRNLRRENVMIREVEDRSQVELFYGLLRKTYNMARMPLPDRSLFYAAFDYLIPRGMARFTLTCVDDTPAAGAVVLIHKDVIYGWYNGMIRSFGRFRPNELLVWDTIKWAAERGYRVLDFGGAGKPDEKYGVRDFKAKFRGQLVNYGRNIRVHAPWRMMISSQAYRLARTILLFSNHVQLGGLGRKVSPEAVAK